ncbi:MAG TPA: hypothetical protein VNN80_11285 [Polyangiaceae bacterium]|nr:hypothetical protein [Polyangiaceae bacterium]
MRITTVLQLTLFPRAIAVPFDREGSTIQRYKATIELETSEAGNGFRDLGGGVRQSHQARRPEMGRAAGFVRRTAATEEFSDGSVHS